MNYGTVAQFLAVAIVIIGACITTIWRAAGVLSNIQLELKLMRMELTYVKSELGHMVVAQKNTQSDVASIRYEISDIQSYPFTRRPALKRIPDNDE